MIGRVVVAAALVLLLTAPPAAVVQTAEKAPGAEQELSEVERRLQELEAALNRLRERLTDEETVARAEELARDLERKLTESAEELAREGADTVLRALDELIDAVPQYEWPEITEDGDIILRRVPPGERRQDRPRNDDIDET